MNITQTDIKNGKIVFSRQGGQWMLLGTKEALTGTFRQVRVSLRNGTEKVVYATGITAESTDPEDGTVYVFATFEDTTPVYDEEPIDYVAPRPDRNGVCHCGGEADTHGRCYQCGGYQRDADVMA